MLNFLQLFSLFSPETFGIRAIEAAEAFDTPPQSRTARRYATIAFGCLFVGAVLLVTAALVDVFANARPLSEIFGWAGIVCLILSVYGGLRYKAANRYAAERSLTEQMPQADRDCDSGR